MSQVPTGRWVCKEYVRTVGSGLAKNRWSVSRTRSEDFPTDASPIYHTFCLDYCHLYKGGRCGGFGNVVLTSNDEFKNIVPCNSSHRVSRPVLCNVWRWWWVFKLSPV